MSLFLNGLLPFAQCGETQMLETQSFAEGMGGWGLNQGDVSFAVVSQETMENGHQAVVVEILDRDSQPYNVQFRHLKLSFEQGRAYLLRFRAKAVAERDVKISAQEAREPYKTAWSENVFFDGDWKDYEVSVLPSASIDGARIIFDLGVAPGKVWFSDVSLVATE